MIFTIPNSEGLPTYQIKPHNSECWELWEYRPVKEKDQGKETGRTGFKWVSMGKYPSTLTHALLTLHEYILKRTDIELGEFDKMALAVMESEKRLREAVC